MEADMRRVRHGVFALAFLVWAAAAEAQPGIVTLGPAGGGTREIGFSYSGWSIDNGRSAASGAARYTYNFSSEIGLEGGVEIGSAGSKPFAAATLQLRLMTPPRPYESSKFVTFGAIRAVAPRGGSPAPRGWGRSYGIGMQQPVSGTLALRFEGQIFVFGRTPVAYDPNRGPRTGLRIAVTIVAGKG
jgi:hypothetical protein